MTRRRRNGFDYVALALDDFALRAAGLGHHEIARRPRRGARLAHYWAERVREHDRDAYARGYADAERDVVAWLRSANSLAGTTVGSNYMSAAANNVERGDHRKERGDG